MRRILFLTALILFAPVASADAPPGLRYPWDQRPDTCFAGEVKSEAVACKLDNWPTQNLAVDRLRILWKSEQFALFERALQELDQERREFVNGYQRYEAPSWFLNSDVSAKDAPKLARWKAAVPETRFAYVAQSVVERKAAWVVRGSGYASTVTEDAWALVEKHLEASEKALLDAPLPAHDIESWHKSLLDTALVRQNPISDPVKVFDDTRKLWPEDYTLYEAMAFHLLPKWTGSWEMLERALATWSAEIPGGGDTLYYRMYYRLRNQPQSAGLKPTEVGIDYPHLRKSGLEIIKRYPEISGFKANLASFACAFRDRETFLDLSGQLPANSLTGSTWLTSFSYEYCSEWAKSGDKKVGGD